MKFSVSRFSALVALGLHALSSPALVGAQPVYFGDRAAFEAALTFTVVDGYSDPGYAAVQGNAAMSAVLGETDYESTGWPEHNMVSDFTGDWTYCAGCNGSFRLSFSTTSVGDPEGVQGVGLKIAVHSMSPQYVALITFADGSTDEVTLPASKNFWGVLSVERIASIHFGLAGGASTKSGNLAIDDLVVGDIGCGDGIVDVHHGEDCDDGNREDGDGCPARCFSDGSCGNGFVDAAAGESCDDGNVEDGDGCSSACRLEYCGNGEVDPGEACDDGNQVSGDGCSADCVSLETCGNGVVDVAAGESCDDGNVEDGDGCQAHCALPTCGDGIVDPGEACDDGDQVSGDGCNATCTSTEVCGNGVVDADELCDQGDENGEEGPCGLDCQLVVPVAPDTGCGCAASGAGLGGALGWVLLVLGALAIRVRARRAPGRGASLVARP